MKRIILLIAILLPLMGIAQHEKIITDVMALSKSYKTAFVNDNGTMKGDNADSYLKAAYFQSIDSEMAESIEFAFYGFAAANYRVSTIYSYITTLYSTDYNGNNAVQPTESLQPFLCNDISPTEHYGMLNPSGESRNVTFTPIPVTGTYTVTIVASDESGGKTTITHTEHTSGTLSSIDFNGKMYAYIIRNIGLTTEQKKFEYDLLQSIYPEIASVKIGEQFWATSNLDITTTCTGTVIPNVTDGATWATSQTLYDNASGSVYDKTKAAAMWDYYDSDPQNGAICGKLYNWYAASLIQQDIDAYNLANPTGHWGWHVPSQAEFETLRTSLGGEAVAGGKMKVEGLDYWSSENASNSSGFSGVGAGTIIASTFYFLKARTYFWSSDSYNGTAVHQNETFDIVSTSSVNGSSIRLIKD